MQGWPDPNWVEKYIISSFLTNLTHLFWWLFALTDFGFILYFFVILVKPKSLYSSYVIPIYRMKIENHLRKIERLENSILKLDDIEDDYEALVELYMLIAAHYVNSSMHKLGILNISKDIKHNKLFSFLKESEKLGSDTIEIRDLMKRLDDLRPGHVYGKGENGGTATKAKEYFEKIRKICLEILNEGKHPDSSWFCAEVKKI